MGQHAHCLVTRDHVQPPLASIIGSVVCTNLEGGAFARHACSSWAMAVWRLRALAPALYVASVGVVSVILAGIVQLQFWSCSALTYQRKDVQ